MLSDGDKGEIRALWAELDSDYVVKDAIHSIVERFRKNSAFLELTTEDLVDLASCTKPEATRALKALSDCHFGRYFNGRRGRQSRLEVWRNNSRHLARLEWFANGMNLSEIEISTPTAELGRGDQSPGEVEFIEQAFCIRKGVMAKIRYPSDLRQDEAQRLAGIVQNLWLVGPA